MFIHNRIINPVGSNTSWDDYVSELLKTAETKTASEAKPECDGDPRGQCRGQEINNDNDPGAGGSYQDGESVKGKSEGKSEKKSEDKKEAKAKKTTKVADCGKEMGESNNAGKVTDKHTEAAPGNDENKEPKVLINNDPCYQTGESDDPAKANKNKKGPGDPVASEKKASSVYVKIASLPRDKKIQLFAKLVSDKNNPIQYVEAMVGIKRANMTKEEKDFIDSYWAPLEGDEYAEEMVKDR